MLEPDIKEGLTGDAEGLCDEEPAEVEEDEVEAAHSPGRPTAQPSSHPRCGRRLEGATRFVQRDVGVGYEARYRGPKTKRLGGQDRPGPKTEDRALAPDRGPRTEPSAGTEPDRGPRTEPSCRTDMDPGPSRQSKD